VVTGHEAERVESFLAGLAGRLGISVRAIRAPDWNLPNGHSVVAGAAAIEGDYLLLMADHLFDPEIARRLLRTSRAGIAVRLAVDRNLAGPLLDLEDATKVEVGGGGDIIRIGKELERFNAIDTGIFLATPALAASIRDTALGDGSLSGGIRLLAEQGQAKTMDIGGLAWIDVDDPHRLGLAEVLVAREAD
jgi:choline kinase